MRVAVITNTLIKLGKPSECMQRSIVHAAWWLIFFLFLFASAHHQHSQNRRAQQPYVDLIPGDLAASDHVIALAAQTVAHCFVFRLDICSTQNAQLVVGPLSTTLILRCQPSALAASRHLLQ